MRRAINVILSGFAYALCVLAALPPAGRAVTIADVAAKTKSLKPQERLEYLAKGARTEGELVYYGTIPIDEFLPLARVFNSRYLALALHHFFSPRQGILSRALTEARAGRHAVDVIQVDLSYGYQLLNENLVQPYVSSGQSRFFDGTYDPNGSWYSMCFPAFSGRSKTWAPGERIGFPG